MEIIQRLKRDTTTRNKLLLTFLILFTMLIGYRIPLPGINTEYLKVLSDSISNSGVGGFINNLTGNSFSRMSIFALSVTPYISASIILQLLKVLVPPIEAIAKDGSVGQQKMERLTYFLGALVAIVEALALAINLGKRGLFINYTWYTVLYATVIWTVGACFLIWLGQTISNKLLGNGISMILLFNILSTFPGDVYSIYRHFAIGEEAWLKFVIAVLLAIVFFLVFWYVVILNDTEKRIRITNSGKLGMKMAGSDDNVMPLKLNMGGVMPIIFSSTIMSLPALIGQAFTIEDGSFAHILINCCSQGNWFRFDAPIYSLGLILFIPLTYLFSYFYSMISFNAKDIADNLRKNGSVINGIRPGQPTADYLNKQAKSLLWLGTTMLLLIVLLPTFVSGIFGIEGLSFGGTTIIIIVGVILEMKNTVVAQTSSVAYKSLIKKRNRKVGAK